MKVSEIILLAWSKGQLSEGKASHLLGVDRLTARTMRDEFLKEHMGADDKDWKIESIKSGSPDDLFEAIITTEQGTKLIAQVPTMETAEEIVNLKYERDVYLALLGQVNSAITYNSDREAQDGLYGLPAGLAQSIYMAVMQGLPWLSAGHEGGRTLHAPDGLKAGQKCLCPSDGIYPGCPVHGQRRR